VLSETFGPKIKEVTGDWRKLHNEELHDLYRSPAVIRVMKWRRTQWAGYVTCLGVRKDAYRVLVGKHEGTAETDSRRILTL
jgi:hypothetical protein